MTAEGRLVDQIVFEDGKGDCLAACVATVLGLSRDRVPNFAESGFFDGLRDWLNENCLMAIEVRFAEGDHFASAYFGYDERLVVMWGDSPRFASGGKRKGHAVVGMPDGYGCKMIHDPHPSRAGLHGHPRGVMWILPISNAINGS